MVTCWLHINQRLMFLKSLFLYIDLKSFGVFGTGVTPVAFLKAFMNYYFLSHSKIIHVMQQIRS